MLNVVALMGRLTADPELRYTQGSNIPVTTFTLAVDRSYVKQGTERQADFIDIVAWRSTAEFVSRYFRKGQLVAVQGSIQTRSYEDKQGIKRKAFEIVADSVHFAEPKRDNYMIRLNLLHNLLRQLIQAVMLVILSQLKMIFHSNFLIFQYFDYINIDCKGGQDSWHLKKMIDAVAAKDVRKYVASA